MSSAFTKPFFKTSLVISCVPILLALAGCNTVRLVSSGGRRNITLDARSLRACKTAEGDLKVNYAVTVSTFWFGSQMVDDYRPSHTEKREKIVPKSELDKAVPRDVTTKEWHRDVLEMPGCLPVYDIIVGWGYPNRESLCIVPQDEDDNKVARNVIWYMPREGGKAVMVPIQVAEASYTPVAAYPLRGLLFVPQLVSDVLDIALVGTFDLFQSVFGG